MIGFVLTLSFIYVLLRVFEYVQVFQPRTELIQSPSTIHSDPTDLFLPTENGYRLNAWFFSTEYKSPWDNWVVLVSHGNGGNMSYRLDLYKLWLEAGFSVLAYDYRGYGLSSGRPSERGTYEDAETAYRWLIDQGFMGSRILALGESLGGAVATELATRHQLGGLVLQSTFTRITDIGKELFPWLPVETLSSIEYDTHSKLPSLALPILILHSREDTLISFRHAERNLAACRETAFLRGLVGDHNDGMSVTAQIYTQHIAEYKGRLTPNSEPDSSDPKID